MKDEDIKKIFSVAWVKERKILVGSVVVVAVIGLIIFIQGKEDADYAKCMKKVEEQYMDCLRDAQTLTYDKPIEAIGVDRVCGKSVDFGRQMCKVKVNPQ